MAFLFSVCFCELNYTLSHLRHPYVKPTTKNKSLQKQKTQATKMDLIAWFFRFY